METQPKTIEMTANFEGNESEVLFQRLRNDKIKNQIIDLMMQAEQLKVGTIRRITEVDEHDKVITDSAGNARIKEIPFSPHTKEDLENLYDEKLHDEGLVTNIAFEENPYETPTANAMVIGSHAPWSNEPLNIKQMSILEAHEKGHRIREYFDIFFDDYFRKGFDFSAISYTSEDLAIHKKILSKEDRDMSLEEMRMALIAYLSQAVELVERMSQLKNYYGMGADEIFTKEHLEYAKEHYIQDTDMNNEMKYFLEAVTPATEEEFLKIINSSGV